MKNFIVGLYSPYPGAGKTTVANALAHSEFVPVKFAGCLKIMLRSCLQYQGLHHEEVQRMVEGDLKEVPSPYLCGRTPRHAMQTLGTEWGRDLIGEGMWLGTTQKRIDLYSSPDHQTPIVIDDLRFPNELKFLKSQSHYTLFVKILRKGFVIPTGHASEGSLNDATFDLVLENGPEFTAEEFGIFAGNEIIERAQAFYRS